LVNSQANDIATGNAGAEPIVPILKELSLDGGVLGWFLEHSKNTILLGEGNFEFSNSLVSLGLPPLLATTDVLSCLPSGSYPTARANSMVGVDATRLHTNKNFVDKVRRKGSDKTNVVWNFPFITDRDENATEHEILIRDTFQSLKIFFEASFQIQGEFFCLGLQGDQFSRWNVLKSAWAVGWKLHAWDCYQCTDFPGYIPRRSNGDAFPAGSTRFYIFKHGNR